MAKDYKHHTSRDSRREHRTSEKTGKVGLLRWMAITAVAIGFAVFLVYLKSHSANQVQPNNPPPLATKRPDVENARKEPADSTKPVAPHFDFYQILPKKEVIVKDYEVKTRSREEQVGKQKPTNYILQAGSFREYEEADEMRAKLALMGIEAKINKAKVENVVWYRVKIGTYNQLESVNSTMSRLQQNGIKPVVTEVEAATPQTPD
jgi:cell division protein FtsN